MKIFIDTANLNEIKKAKALGLVDGVTTNPTLLAKEGEKTETLIRKIWEEVRGPVNVEVIGTTCDEMVKEARVMAAWGDEIVIKIPITLEGLKAVKILSGEGIRTNVTLVFSPSQAILAAKAGATYVCPFLGRLDDISFNGLDLIQQIRGIYVNYEEITDPDRRRQHTKPPPCDRGWIDGCRDRNHPSCRVGADGKTPSDR